MTIKSYNDLKAVITANMHLDLTFCVRKDISHPVSYRFCGKSSLEMGESLQKRFHKEKPLLLLLKQADADLFLGRSGRNFVWIFLWSAEKHILSLLVALSSRER